MTAILLILVGVIAYQAGEYLEWRRVLRYLDRHLDRDADWLRSGIDAEHHARRNTRREGTP